MYSDSDLDDAVAAGAVSAEAATALRLYFDRHRSGSAVDEEQFRLVTGFNDIFVSIAAAILLFAVAWIGSQVGPRVDVHGPSPIGAAAVAAVAWGLALFFTTHRRMALPSILLLLVFVGGVFTAAALGMALALGPDRLDNNSQLSGMLGAFAAATGAVAAWFHWRHFRVPFTVAAGAGAVAAIGIGLIFATLGERADVARDLILGAVLLIGVGIFLFAMWWDASDRSRVTRRSDVAFWLHLLAAPMIVHPVFTLLGLNDGQASIGEGFVVVLLYIALGLTALAIDRRALLVSALAYVLWALADLFKRFGAVELNVALTALVIGSALLLLSAFWQQARAAVVRPLPDGLRQRLPVLDRSIVNPQPAA
jgi:cytochrome bd-type quinol oxidase subunit 2